MVMTVAEAMVETPAGAMALVELVDEVGSSNSLLKLKLSHARSSSFGRSCYFSRISSVAFQRSLIHSLPVGFADHTTH